MFTKKISAAALIVSGLLFAGSASAVDVSVENYVGNLVNNAFEVASQEITYGVQEAILNAGNSIVMDESEVIASSVTITDLESTESKVDTKEKAE